MTTITIKSTPKFQQSTFDNMEELIETYFSAKGKILLQEIDIDSLPSDVQNDITKSQKLGKAQLVDFQG